MSFLDVQDLATVTAQSGLGRLIMAWCADSDVLLGVLELGVLAVIVAALLRRRHKDRP